MAQRSDPNPEEQARILKVIDTARADGFVSARPYSLDGIGRAASIWLAPGTLRAQIEENYLAFPGAFLVLARAGQGGFNAGQYILAPAILRASDGRSKLALIVFVAATTYDKAKGSANPMATLVGLEWGRLYQAPKP
jgi:hypothetical protein